MHLKSTSAAFAIEALQQRKFLSTTILVDINAPGPGHDGNSWATAYNDLQAALTAAVAGDEIHVANGTYYPSATNDRTATIQLKNDVMLLGGYAGYGATTPDARDVTANVTILSGNIGAVGVTTDNSYHVVTGSGTNATAVLDGFVISDGNAPTQTGSGGGGMLNLTGSPTVRNCRFSSNQSTTFNGGAVSNYNGSSPSFTNCTFNNNLGYFGGAVASEKLCSIVFDGCTFTSNATRVSGTGNGGALWSYDRSSTDVRSSTFTSNSSGYGGGAIWANNKSPVKVADSSFTSNTAKYFGGAIDLAGLGDPSQITQCTFTQNSSGNNGGALYVSGNTLNAADCTFTANSSQDGGAVYNMISGSTYTRCAFVRNSGYEGGALWQGSSSPTAAPAPQFLACSFLGNTAGTTGSGGAVFYDGYASTTVNCVFVGNSAGYGGATFIQNAEPTIANCTIVSNVAISKGGAFYIFQAAGSIANAIVRENNAPTEPQVHIASSTTTFSYTNLSGGYAGVGNMDLDPVFVQTPNPGADVKWGTIDDNYGNLRLNSGSPSIDTGDNASIPAAVTTDRDGNIRTVDIPGANDPGAIVDMGAYERTMPLVVRNDTLNFDASHCLLSLQFSSAVEASTLGSGDLQLVNTTTQQSLNVPGLAQLSYDPNTFIAKWAFSPLPDGNYEATITMNSVTDPATAGLASDYVARFFILSADGDRNRRVDIQDFNILATDFGKSGQTFSQGNYDYSSDGKVTILDFNVLATNFGKHLDSPTGTQAISQSFTQPTSFMLASPVVRQAGLAGSMSDDRNLLVESGLV